MKLVIALAVALFVGLSFSSAEPVSALDCGDVEHWVDKCPAGTDPINPTEALAGIDYIPPLDCKQDTSVMLDGPLTVQRSAPRDASTEFPNVRPTDGHLDVIDTQITNMVLMNGDGTITYKVGVDAPGISANIQPSFGAVVERPSSPKTATSFFFIYFEVTTTTMGVGPFYNHLPLVMRSTIDRVPPVNKYFPPPGYCLPLFDNPIPGMGAHVANAVGAQHDLPSSGDSGNLAGAWEIIFTLVPSSPAGQEPVSPGAHIICRAVFTKKPHPAYGIQIYCYLNVPDVDINPAARPGCKGSGLRDLLLELPTPEPTPTETPLHHSLKQVKLTPPLPPVSSNCGIVWGDMDSEHVALNGSLIGEDLEFSGCIEGGSDAGAGTLGGNLYIDATINASGDVGTADIHPNMSLADCQSGENLTTPSVASVRANRNSTDLSHDSDGDGCSDAHELGNDQGAGGLRDPYNRWDFYDVDGDRVIGLFGDIFPVAFDFGTAGSDATDRAAPILGGNDWNLPGPDGLVTLFDDIFGVAFQFGHDCSA
ncbi:MAG: flexitail domain-containing putative surface protein [Dehalococcoidia bacterium]